MVNKKLRAAVLVLGLSAGAAYAQNVTVNPGAGNYADLKTAFDRINDGTHTGAVTISITGDTTESAPAVLNASGSGAASYTSVLITPSGTRTVSGAIAAGSPLIDLNGADNVTIDGLNTAGNALTISNTTVSTTSGTSTIRFIGGATANVITNSTILGSSSGIVTANTGNIFFSTDANTPNGNDNNTISNNTIGPAGANLPSKGILCNGTQTTIVSHNSGNTVTNNNFADIFNATGTSSAMAANAGCNTWSITNNRFYQTATRTWTTGAVHRAIDLSNSGATTGAQGFTITGNVIGYASPMQTGTYTLTGSTGKFHAINVNTTTGSALNTIANNTIANISLSGVTSSGTSTSAIFIGILATNGVTNITANTIGSQSATGSIVVSTNTTTNTDVIGIYNFTVDPATYNDNTIGGITASNAGASGAFIVYGIRNNTGNTIAFNASGNLVGGTVANSIQNNSTSNTAQTLGLVLNLGILNVRNNTFRNFTGAGGIGTGTGASVIGISATNTTPNHTLEGNTIFSLRNTNASAATVVSGIHYTAGTGANLVHRNLIHSLSAASATAVINGIDIRGGTTVYRNNMIRLGTDAAGTDITAGVSINGINELLGTNTVFNNSVLIRGVGVLGTANTFAFNGQQTVNTRSFQNNNFYNARSNGAGTGKHYGIRVGGSAPNPAGLTSNYNNVFVDGTGGVFGLFNALDVANLAAWQAATGQDANSISANPAYVSFSDLHLTSASPSRDVGLVIPSVTNDFDNKTRPGANALYDIGADEFDGIAPVLNDIAATAFVDPTSPGLKPANVAFAPQASFSNPGVNAQTNVPVRYRIFDATLTEVYNQTTTIAALASGATATATFANATLAAGNYTTRATAELPGDGAAANDTINGTLTVAPPLAGGTYTVGSGGDYASLTNSGGIFQALNSLGTSGNVVINIISDLTGESGSVALNEVAGGFTVTIKPSGAARSITSTANATAVIKLNDVDNVTIDGSLNGGTDRSLSITNTNPLASTAVIWLGSAVNGAQGNTIKNTQLAAGADQSVNFIFNFGIISSSSAAILTGGLDNDNNTFSNNFVRRVSVGIASIGGQAANLNQNTSIANNLIGPAAFGSDQISLAGVLLFNENAVNVIANEIRFIGDAATTGGSSGRDHVGIVLGSTGASWSTSGAGTAVTVTNANVSRNLIHDIVDRGTFSAAGITLNGVNASGATNNTVANNMIYNILANGTSGDQTVGIGISSGNGDKVVFNSVFLTGDVDPGTAGAASTPSFGISVATSTPTNLTLKNNIAVMDLNSNTGTLFHAAINVVATTYPWGTGGSDFNDWHAPAANPQSRVGSTAAGGAFYSTLAAWQAAVTQDPASVSVDPLFVSPTDLHLQSASTLIGIGLAGTGVTNDFDNQTRDAAPDIGADELLAASLTITPGSVDFGNQPVGSTSAEQTVTLANTGSTSLDVTALTAAATPFARTGTGTCSATLPITIAGGASCTLTYTFSPTAAGAANQNLTVTASAPGSGTIALSGTGTQGTLTINPGAVNFGNQLVGTTSSEQTVTLANTGNAPLNVTALTAASAPFARTGTGTCAATLPITIAAGANCTLTYTFAPTAGGAANQTLTVTANAPGSGTIALQGTGTQGNLTIAPGTVNFGNQNTGTTSAAQTVTLGNNGTATLTVNAITVANAPFSRVGTGTCSGSLPFTIAAGASCTLQYTFSPTAGGPFTQNITVGVDGTGGGPFTLNGTGVVQDAIFANGFE